MSELFDIRGRPALVTGASSGLGRHFALTLAAAGAPVALAARRQAALADLAARIEETGAQAVVVPMDVTCAESVEAGVATAEEALGALQIVVNNAGIVSAGTALETRDEDWRAVLDTNLTGAFLVARAAARRMVASSCRGSIINIASILSYRVVVGVASYAASKAGLTQLTGVLALELARHGIRVNALAPGYIATELNRDFFATEPGQAMIRRIPQRRLGSPAELDGALLLLASDASSYMTGTTVVVDGGHLHSSL